MSASLVCALNFAASCPHLTDWHSPRVATANYSRGSTPQYRLSFATCIQCDVYRQCAQLTFHQQIVDAAAKTKPALSRHVSATVLRDNADFGKNQ
jgi:hypothetical protein